MFQRVATVIYRLSSVVYRLSSTTVENSLQISPFMQNEPNFPDDPMNVNKVITRDYENIANCKLRENKPNQTQYKANKNQNKPNTNPIRTQTNPVSKAKLHPKSPKKLHR